MIRIFHPPVDAYLGVAFPVGEIRHYDNRITFTYQYKIGYQEYAMYQSAPYRTEQEAAKIYLNFRQSKQELNIRWKSGQLFYICSLQHLNAIPIIPHGSLITQPLPPTPLDTHSPKSYVVYLVHSQTYPYHPYAVVTDILVAPAPYTINTSLRNRNCIIGDLRKGNRFKPPKIDERVGAFGVRYLHNDPKRQRLKVRYRGRVKTFNYKKTGDITLAKIEAEAYIKLTVNTPSDVLE